MLSEQDKQAILNGAPAITQGGLKAVYVGIASNEECLKYGFVVYKNDTVFCYIRLNSDLNLYGSTTYEHNIIGLWKEPDEPEPFNLERALSGEPVLLKNGLKAFILNQVGEELAKLLQVEDQSIVGYAENNNLHLLSWDAKGEDLVYVDKEYSIIGMWRESKRPTITLTLPCPLRKPQEGMWLLGDSFNVMRPHPINVKREEPKTMELIQECLNNGRAFATDEDAQAWLDALRDNRR